ncbi:hypothetical protein L6R52_11290 [Myxococcota bacterium]|nr:hypothetical protein [Myxococcota bacterium]
MPLAGERSLVFQGLRTTWCRTLSATPTHLALVEGRNRLIVLPIVDGQATRLQALCLLPFGPSSIQVGDDGDYVLLGSTRGNYAGVWSTKGSKMLLELAGPDAIAATLTHFRGQEVLLTSRHPGELQVWSLTSAQPIATFHDNKEAPFVIDRIHACGGRWNLVGHRFLDVDEQLVSLDPEQLGLDSANFQAALETPASTAQRLACGPAPDGVAVVVHQEEVVRGGRVQVLRATGLDRDVKALGVSGLVERVFATPKTLALFVDGHLELWSRDDGTRELTVDARAVDFDAASARVAVLTPDAKLRFLMLA